MDYLLKSSILVIAFYLCYTLFLRRETFFQSNRWFLLIGLVTSMVLPLIVIPNYIEYSVVETTGFNFNTMADDPTAAAVPLEENSFNYMLLALSIYYLGVAFLFGKLILELLSLANLLSSSAFTSESGFKLIETNQINAPFSFFNRIVLNPNSFSSEELEFIISHEKVHVQQHHSIDIMIAQLSCIIFWFNPIVWLYKNALKQNLEFIADRQVQNSSSCQKSYQTLLLKASVPNQTIAITNQFFTSLIKKRILMLHKSKSNPLHQIKLFIILPLLAIFMMSFSVKDIFVAVPLDDTNVFNELDQLSETIEVIITKDTSDKELERIQNELKDKGITFTFSGVKRNGKGEITAISTTFKNEKHASNYDLKGDNGIKPIRFMSNEDSFSIGTLQENSNNFIYETDDNETKVQSSGEGANVYIFENDDNDDSEDVNVKVKRSKGESKVIIKKNVSGGTWISQDGTKTNINASEHGNNKVFIAQSEEPIFIVNGKAVSKAYFEDVDSEDIQSVEVLKGESAVKAYGHKGQNGVVIMRTNGTQSASDSDTNTFIYRTNGAGATPLYIVDGKILSEDDIEKIDPKHIDKVEVLKEAKAIKAYGKSAKDGAVIISTTKGRKIAGNAEPIIIEIEEESPYVIQNSVSSVYFVEDDSKERMELIVTKDASDAFLEQHKSKLKTKGIDAKFTKVRRNKAGEITSIKITLDDNQGRKSSASWKEKNQTIPDIVLGKTGSTIFVRAIGE